jgi:translation initiation factor 6 (eIF-6)
MEEELTKMQGKFSFREDEHIGVSLETSKIIPTVNRGKACVEGKLVANRKLL